jgi:GntR family transcriptional regulator, transcriptional repressor for pyruvate dehydrogenase complex
MIAAITGIANRLEDVGKGEGTAMARTAPKGGEAGLSLTPPSRRKLTQTVAEQLLNEIRRRRLAPGTRMPSERELMQALNVGRSTVREALNGLVMLGVIEIRHGQGAFVTERPRSQAEPEAIAAALAKGVTRDLLEARRPVEIEMARLAAERRTAADLSEIEAVLDAHQRARTDQQAARSSARFHRLLAQAAHNEVLAGFVASYQKLLAERGPLLEEQIEGYREWELAEHRRLHEAVRDGDAELAAKRMRAHLTEVAKLHERLANLGNHT